MEGEVLKINNRRKERLDVKTYNTGTGSFSYLEFRGNIYSTKSTTFVVTQWVLEQMLLFSLATLAES